MQLTQEEQEHVEQVIGSGTAPATPTARTASEAQTHGRSGSPPDRHPLWGEAGRRGTLELTALIQQIGTLEEVDELSDEPVRRVLKKQTQAVAEGAVVPSA